MLVTMVTLTTAAITAAHMLLIGSFAAASAADDDFRVVAMDMMRLNILLNVQLSDRR